MPVFSAAINWGDGHTSDGNVVQVGTSNVYDVEGGNTYSLPGKYSVNITVQDQTGDSGTISSNVIVTPLAPAIFSGTTFAVTTGVPFTAPVATFTDSNPLANKSNITAVINWGDGHISNGTITGPDANGVYSAHRDEYLSPAAPGH